MYHAEKKTQSASEGCKCTDSYVFALCPTTAPTNNCQAPTFTNWCIHESILCTTSTEAMRGEAASRSLTDLSTHSRLIDPTLHSVMRYVFLWLHNAIGTHCGENVVVRIHRTAIVFCFKILDPKGQPAEGVARRQLWLGKEFVMVAWLETQG